MSHCFILIWEFLKHVFLLFFVSFIVVSTIVTLIQGYISHKKNIPNKFMSIIEMFVIYLRDDVLKILLEIKNIDLGRL